MKRVVAEFILFFWNFCPFPKSNDCLPIHDCPFSLTSAEEPSHRAVCTAGVLLESDAARAISFPQSLPSGSAWPRTTQGDARHGCGRRAPFRLRREAASARTRERGYSISAKRHGCSRQGERLLTGEFSPNAGRVAGPSVFSVESTFDTRRGAAMRRFRELPFS